MILLHVIVYCAMIDRDCVLIAASLQARSRRCLSVMDVRSLYVCVLGISQLPYILIWVVSQHTTSCTMRMIHINCVWLVVLLHGPSRWYLSAMDVMPLYWKCINCLISTLYGFVTLLHTTVLHCELSCVWFVALLHGPSRRYSSVMNVVPLYWEYIKCLTWALYGFAALLHTPMLHSELS